MDDLDTIKLSEEVKAKLTERQGEIVRIIEAFQGLEKSKEWETVRELVFDKALSSIDRQLLVASLEREIDPSKLYRLQGERDWAKRYMDLGLFITPLRKELEDIKKKLT